MIFVSLFGQLDRAILLRCHLGRSCRRCRKLLLYLYDECMREKFIKNISCREMASALHDDGNHPLPSSVLLLTVRFSVINVRTFRTILLKAWHSLMLKNEKFPLIVLFLMSRFNARIYDETKIRLLL